ncbi:Hint domain-containing protein [Planktomarina temperata]|nr:Hint domain-containing protein [Planktomarina temperata]MDB9880618.1 Hint domain-containing protein [Planktomarina temperata]
MTNLITNGSLDDGIAGNAFQTSAVPTNWYSAVGSIDMNRTHSVSPGEAPITGSPNDGGDFVWLNAFEAFGHTLAGGALPAGTYTLEFEVWADSGHRGFFDLVDQNGTLLQTVTVGNGEVWHTVAVNFVSDGTVTDLVIQNNFNDGAAGFMAFDGFGMLPLCFASGTLIKTQSGEVAIEDLSVGNMVLTMDHGYQPIRWISSSKRRAIGNMAPILIRKGALGNTRDLRVSPQHRMLLSSWHAEVLFGEREVLATAKSLVNDHSILREEGGEVEYFHMLFDTHEIVYAEGAPSESFHPGPEGWKALDAPTRNEILELFPQLANGNFDSYGPSARASLKYKEGSLLSHSMISQTQH